MQLFWTQPIEDGCSAETSLRLHVVPVRLNFAFSTHSNFTDQNLNSVLQVVKQQDVMRISTAKMLDTICHCRVGLRQRC
ncbi:hypothetical protein D9R08_09360 [Rhodophyticola porphyridii]|uniref:Uncharacterized protein n=1 Tax=Rhodophyticola porphyridii TaxID=1852017 RepID=A0A3L9YHK3_9RHOB|nr:hypothetical protein D9R08_09360 [Rhodophyticola porphyridii]